MRAVVRRVIATQTIIGRGGEGDPARPQYELWTLDGRLIVRMDSLPTTMGKYDVTMLDELERLANEDEP